MTHEHDLIGEEHHAATDPFDDVSHFDDFAVAKFATHMKAKMALARGKGRCGWNDPTKCNADYLRQLLYEHLEKGDPVDVANICMMLHFHKAGTARDFGNTLDLFRAQLAELRADLGHRY
jgi:hypothetical protein